MTAEIARDLDLAKLLELTIRRAAALVGAVSGVLYVWDEPSQVLIPRARHGFGQSAGDGRVLPGEEALGTVARRREAVIVNDYQASPYTHLLLRERSGVTAVLAQPLLYRDALIGVITVNHETAGRAFTQQHQRLLGIFAAEAAIAIENARLCQELAGREGELRDLVGRLLLAQEEERRRAAYQILDGLAQVATAVQQHLEAFASTCLPCSPEARQELGRVLQLAQQMVEEARRVVAGLWPAALDDFGLAAALGAEVDALRTKGWQITYEDQLGSERLPPVIEAALFRAAREMLGDVHEHTGITRAHLALERRGQSVRLEVRGSGRGFQRPARPDGVDRSARDGLPEMRERIAWLGGRCTVRRRPGAGARIVVVVPLPAPAAGGGHGG